MRVAGIVLVLMLGCGRIAFDPLGSSSDGSIGDGSLDGDGGADAVMVTPCTAPCFTSLAATRAVLLDLTTVNYLSMGSTLYFVADDGVNGRELWGTDGTEAGTRMVADINPTGHSDPFHFVSLGGTLYFFADDGTRGRELWRSDGTQAGTSIVRDIHPTGSGLTFVFHVTVVNSRIVFAGNDGVAGPELWASDGTSAGTIMIKEFIAGATGANPSDMHAIDPTTAVISARDPTSGIEVWRSNGTPGGTALIADAVPGLGDSLPSGWFRYFGSQTGYAYYRGTDGTNGLELWRTNGINAQMVADLEPGVSNGVNSSPNIVPALGRVFFQGMRTTTGYEPYVSDGSPAGTFALGNLNPAGDSLAASSSYFFYEHAGRVYFRASNGVDGVELFLSDGTPAGTRLVANIHPAGSSNPLGFFTWNGGLYFGADDGTHGRELWVTDGTVQGTQLVQDLAPAGSADPFFMGWVGTTPVLVADDDAGVARLWVGR